MQLMKCGYESFFILSCAPAGLFLLATEYVLIIIIILIDRFIYSSALVSHALYLVNHM